MVSKKILLNLLKIFENSKFDDLEPIFYDGNFEEIRKIYSDINGKLSKFQKKKKKADKFNVEEYFKILKLRIIFGENWYKKKGIKLEKVIYKTINEKLEITEIKITDFIDNKDKIRKKYMI
ncbi:Uncharacterised protein [Sebaldella termitidis]|jgi:hypothetical protein|uniref:Uncharacterized protein n=1 Tax=Sebaldella termitidis (strain ATCC 33386 / NCTC 11300) TaxID=526218 RepID=D1AKG2_SEBTE|nr:hypothetical protein [Sebaldella termitidis]ACZ09078.1 hypothetical protein Sterm_2224 [Sebaldella termitidis ATCC 33386]SUI24396.1 Uncharacterised protein [Sebaldella termitidis]